MTPSNVDEPNDLLKTEQTNFASPTPTDVTQLEKTASQMGTVQPAHSSTTGTPAHSPQPVQTTQPVQPIQQTTQQTQPVTNTLVPSQATYQTTNSTKAIKTPADLYDNTVQNYLNDYQNGVNINDYQAQINALKGIDDYRQANGLKPMYTADIYELTNERTNKIKGIIADYEADMAEAMQAGDMELVQTIGNQLSQYKKDVNYTDSVENSATFLKDIQYKATYDEAINQIVAQLLTSKFAYDPSQDQALLKAQQYATNTVYESMSARGILDSTMTAQIVTKTVDELIPVYEKMAKEEFYENIERLQTMATFLSNMEDRNYERWYNNVQMRLSYYQALKDEKSYQWQRVEQLGYVDNEASIILGVPVGMMSSGTRQAIHESEMATQKMYNQLQTDIALAQAKADLEVQVYGAKAQIDASYGKYKTSSKSSSNGKYSGYIITDKEGNETDLSSYLNMTKADAQKTIKAEIENNQMTESEAYELVANLIATGKSKLNDSSYVEIFGKPKNTVEQDYSKNKLAEQIDELYGGVTSENSDQVRIDIANAVKAGNIDKDIAENYLSELDTKEQKENFNLFYENYVGAIESQLALAKAYANGEDGKKPKNIKNITWYKTLDDLKTKENEIKELIGEDNYETIFMEVEAKQRDLKKILENNGIKNW